MTGGIRLVVADIAVQGGAVAGCYQVQVQEPVGEIATQRLGSLGIAVNDDPTSRKVFDISPGQVSSCRAAPQIRRMRLGVEGPRWRRSAAVTASRAASHSTGSSNSGSAKPGPAFRSRGLLWYSS